MGLQEKVLLKGFCKDVHQRIVNAAMFVMTSDYEGMPNALLEAMAIGVPCISTDCPCGGPRYLIQSGVNGVLVPVGSCKHLYEAMCNMIEHNAEAVGMGENAVRIRLVANTTYIVDQWDKLLTAK